MIKKIAKTSDKVDDEAGELVKRLNEFETKNLSSDVTEHIPDQDIIFLKKEVSRYKSSLQILNV